MMTRDQMLVHLRTADAVARDAVAHGHHPFGAVLVGPDDHILMRQGNIDTVRHAETELARRAAAAYPPESTRRNPQSQMGHVDLARGNLNLPDSKTGARTVPLNKQACEILRKHLASKNGPFVIKSATGRGRPALGKPWERIRGRARIDDTTNINSLRHTFASWSVMGGLSLPQTGALLGHKSAQTTLRYADHLTQAIRGYSQQTANLIAAE